MKTSPDNALNGNRRRNLRIALWALLLLGGHALQVVAVTHWHGGTAAASAVASQPQSPTGDHLGHDGCLLCQVAAHAGDSAPPPPPWILHVAPASRAQFLPAAGVIAAVLRPSHDWQGRAPPQV